MNRYVAIAEEFANDASTKVKAGGLLHDRKVARIVTPGTLIDENFIDPLTNNYVLAIQRGRGVSQAEPGGADDLVGLAWLDLSTGNFYTQSTTLALLSSAISRIGPREIVLEKDQETSAADALMAVLSDDSHVITYCSVGERKPMASWEMMLESKMPADIAASFASEEVDAGSLLLEYVGTRLQGLSLKLQPPIQYRSQEIMAIDRNSLRGLEIMENYRDGTYVGSLLHALRKTVTKSGSRLLKEWLGMFPTSKRKAFLIYSRCSLNITSGNKQPVRSCSPHTWRYSSPRTADDPAPTLSRLSTSSPEVCTWKRKCR